MAHEVLDFGRVVLGQMLRGKPKRQVRPSFDGVEVRRDRFEGTAQSRHLVERIGQGNHQTKKYNLIM